MLTVAGEATEVGGCLGKLDDFIPFGERGLCSLAHLFP